MDEKTAELREIFIDTTGSDTVTESQEESPGSLSEEDEAVEPRLVELVARMRGRYEFTSGLEDDVLVDVVRCYHEELSDEEIADVLDLDVSTVFDARMDLHLVRESDRDAPLQFEELRRMIVEDVPIDERAARLDASVETIEHYSEVIETDNESTRANDRFRDEFAELLTDQDLSSTLARDAREDGLKDATEDIETDVSF